MFSSNQSEESSIFCRITSTPLSSHRFAFYSCTVPLQSLLDQAASRLDMNVGDVGYNSTDRSVPEWDVYSQREVGIRCFEHDLLATQRSGLKILVSIFCSSATVVYSCTLLLYYSCRTRHRPSFSLPSNVRIITQPCHHTQLGPHTRRRTRGATNPNSTTGYSTNCFTDLAQTPHTHYSGVPHIPQRFLCLTPE